MAKAIVRARVLNVDPKDADSIIKRLIPGGMEDEPEDKEPHEDDKKAGLESAFEDLARALGIDPGKLDVAAGVEALESFLHQCDEPEEDKEDDDGKEW